MFANAYALEWGRFRARVAFSMFPDVCDCTRKQIPPLFRLCSVPTRIALHMSTDMCKCTPQHILPISSPSPGHEGLSSFLLISTNTREETSNSSHFDNDRTILLLSYPCVPSCALSHPPMATALPVLPRCTPQKWHAPPARCVRTEYAAACITCKQDIVSAQQL